MWGRWQQGGGCPCWSPAPYARSTAFSGQLGLVGSGGQHQPGDPALLGAQADGRRSVPGSSPRLEGWLPGVCGSGSRAFMEVTRGCPLWDEGCGEEMLGFPRVSGTSVGCGNLRRGAGPLRRGSIVDQELSVQDLGWLAERKKRSQEQRPHVQSGPCPRQPDSLRWERPSCRKNVSREEGAVCAEPSALSQPGLRRAPVCPRSSQSWDGLLPHKSETAPYSPLETPSQQTGESCQRQAEGCQDGGFLPIQRCLSKIFTGSLNVLTAFNHVAYLPVCQQNPLSEPSCELHLPCKLSPDQPFSVSCRAKHMCEVQVSTYEQTLNAQGFCAEKSYILLPLLDKNLLKGSNSSLSLMNLINPVVVGKMLSRLLMVFESSLVGKARRQEGVWSFFQHQTQPSQMGCQTREASSLCIEY
ncbi:unnamed protein product [Rangifer tarandus platyrhynchus]|uniref:Uncharacterized protein n=2 Tax=Rangifer tarandus platyrhynchus TaxID=3082113 RepID=A0ABN8ZX79_RANTA|nr:unnamed protein product [Rangifer tarandus platyrhynchus]CAI9711225.1 unnamed protein product [Rangifer tarandus platyrhynchus]